MKIIDKVKRYNEIATIAVENDAFTMLWKFITASRENSFVITDMDISDTMPAKFRNMLEKLGPSFIKIGQLLSTRPDLMPKSMVDELSNLYDHTTPTPYEEIEKVVETELGMKISEIFTSFEKEPIASASIAQVHQATLKSGECVAVKIQHPNIEQNLLIDFEILASAAKFDEKEFADAKVWQPQKHLSEFKRMVLKELDFKNEARNQQTFYENFKDMLEVCIPKVFWDYCTQRILTMQFIDGVKPLNAQSLVDKNISGENIAKILTNSMAKQIFIDRFFHGDPSPGNLLIKDANTIAFIDFGAVGILTRHRKDVLTQMIMAFITGNVEELARSFITLCDKEGEVDEQAFMKDVEKVIDYFEREHPSVGDPTILNMIIEASNKHKMLLPADFMLLMRTWYQFEGLCKRIDPDYDVAVVIAPYLRETVLTQFSKDKQNQIVTDVVMEYLKLFEKFPTKINSIMRKIENNELQLKVSVVGMKDYRDHRMRQTLLLGFTVLIAAIVIGFSIVLSIKNDTFTQTFGIICMLLVLFWLMACILIARK